MASALDQIKKKIHEAKKESSSFTDLDLTDIPINKFTPEIKALIEESKSIEVLYLTNCGLTTLEGFPNIINLVAIDLSKNKIGDDGNIETLLSFPDLTQIIFTDNNVEKVETVLKLSTLKKLIEIDFEGNPVAKVDKYREDVFEKFSNIEFVDRKDKDGNEQEVEEDEFNDEDDDDDDEDEYELEDGEDEDEEDFEEEEESDEKPKKRGRKPK